MKLTLTTAPLPSTAPTLCPPPRHSINPGLCGVTAKPCPSAPNTLLGTWHALLGTGDLNTMAPCLAHGMRYFSGFVSLKEQEYGRQPPLPRMW